MEAEIGKGKRGRITYGFDDVAIVPSRRTRDPDEVDVTMQIGEHRFSIPFLASAMDSIVSPEFAIEMGKLGGLAVLNLEGLWTRYEEPEDIYRQIASFSREEATGKMQAIYSEPVKPELITKRISQVKAAGIACAGSLTPQKVEEYHKYALTGGLDILIIQGTVVSAEHVCKSVEPLDLFRFIPEVSVPVIVGGCCSYSTALHLMRTGAVGILVGVGPGAACTTRRVLGIGVPQATAISDAAAARLRYLEESGNYVSVIADGGMSVGGDISKAIACGADAVMMGSPFAKSKESPGHGFHWGMATFHPTLPRGARVQVGIKGTLKEILMGPAHENDGSLNLVGALKMAMATCGYESVRDFQRAEVIVAPALQTEGKALQFRQG